jgi:hypothetical protein
VPAVVGVNDLVVSIQHHHFHGRGADVYSDVERFIHKKFERAKIRFFGLRFKV